MTAQRAIWFPTSHEDLPLEGIVDYPDLQSVLRLWMAAPGWPTPRAIDPLTIPRALLPYVMVLDLERNPDRLRVRLAGTFVCQKYGGELRGHTTHDFFEAADADLVVRASLQVAASRQPSLARRSYVAMDDNIWSYVRLIVPLSRSGDGVDSFFKVLDPSTLTGSPRAGRGPAQA